MVHAQRRHIRILSQLGKGVFVWELTSELSPVVKIQGERAQQVQRPWGQDKHDAVKQGWGAFCFLPEAILHIYDIIAKLSAGRSACPVIPRPQPYS